MKRKLFNDLKQWKHSKNRLPLILGGSRQVGKSYLLSEFAKAEFESHVLLNFEKDRSLHSIFELDLSPDRILREFSIRAKRKIKPGVDFLILDEIQACPKALNSLKYFCEEMPQLAIAAAGSLLGVQLSSESFPVGKVQFLDLFPLSFEEFLLACQENLLVEMLTEFGGPFSEGLHLQLLERLKQYYYVGGLPRAVTTFLEYQENPFECYERVRDVQLDILRGYSADFAKHSGKLNAQHILSVFENIPMQLSKAIDGSTNRYFFKDVIPGKRDYISLQGPIDWLVKAGLVYKIKICNLAQVPLETFCKENYFKLFLFDIGLLGAMLELPPAVQVLQNYGIAKGYFVENFVAQELKAAGLKKLYSWAEQDCEIEFLQVFGAKIVPIEVKSGLKTQAKSLSRFIEKYPGTKAIKLSSQPLRKINTEDSVLNIPLYFSGFLNKICANQMS